MQAVSPTRLLGLMSRSHWRERNVRNEAWRSEEAETLMSVSPGALKGRLWDPRRPVCLGPIRRAALSPLHPQISDAGASFLELPSRYEVVLTFSLLPSQTGTFLAVSPLSHVLEWCQPLKSVSGILCGSGEPLRV